MSRLQGKKPLFECPSTGLERPVSISILERTKFTSAIIKNSGNWIHTNNVLEEGYALLQQLKGTLSGEATSHISYNHSDLIISTKYSDTPNSMGIEDHIYDTTQDDTTQEFLSEYSGHSDTPNSMGIEKHPVHDFLSDVLKNQSLVYEFLKNLQKSKTVYFMDTGGQPEFHELLPPIQSYTVLQFTLYSLMPLLSSISQ